MITSLNNKEIINSSKLKQKKYRDKTGEFLVEGIKLINEAINSGINFKKLFIQDNFDYNLVPNITQFETIEVSESVLKKLSSQKSPEGIVAIISKKSLPNQINGNRIILLDNIRDPGNFGTIIRTADAAGFDLIICSKNCADLFNEKTLRSSMGSVFHIPVILNQDLKQTISNLKEKQYKVIGTSLDGEILYLNKVNVPSKLALILGNESHGISKDLQSECSQLLKLPIFGKAESLNVSIAAGIFMYAFVDQYNET